jgi:signal transduction histidine kinase
MLINKYYDSSEQEEKKNEYYIQELQKYIHEKNISSKDADQLNRWVEQQKVLHVRVYKDDIVVFDSEYPEQKLWEEEIPANEYECLDYYPIEFADGSAQVNIWGIYDYQFYHYAMIVEVLFSFLLFLLLVLIGIRRKMDYILQLSKEIQILEGGSLEYTITVKGKDELSKLAEGIENMRKSFQRMIYKETEIVRENQKIVTEMSHDLRTPITSIMLYTEILKKGKYENEAQLLEYLKKIDQKARRMKQLSEHLFEYSLLSGEDEVKLEEPDNFETLLYDLFSETCSYLEQRGFQTIFQVRWRIKKSGFLQII